MFDINNDLRNETSPYVSPLIQERLTRLGGNNQFGQPVLKWVWPQTELVFACGRMIPKYRVGVKEERTKDFRLRNIVTGESWPCTFGENKTRWELSRSRDFQDDFIRAETMTRIRIEPIGLPRFVVEQYFSPDKIKDTPERWEANRYRMWFDPEKNQEVLTDILGPFPIHGRYEGFYLVSEPDGTKYGRYRPLTESVLNDIERAWQARSRWKQTQSDESMLVDEFRAATEREDKAEKENAYLINSELKPHMHRFGEIRIYNAKEN